MRITAKEDGETARQYAMRTLLDNIIYFELKPGEKIDEQELCRLCGLSRTPIREAILELSQFRLIDIHPKQGTYVSYIDSKAIYEFIEFRAVIEGKLSQIACTEMTQEHIEHLRELYALWKCHAESNNGIKSHYYDKAFHKYIYDCCNKQYWYHIVKANMYQFDRVITLMQESNYEVLNDDHKKIVEALSSKDKEAAYNIIVAHAYRFNDFKAILQNRYPEYFVN